MPANSALSSSPRLPGPAWALIWALLIEIVLLASLIVIFAHPQPPQPPISEPVALTIVDNVTPPAPVTLPKPVPPQPKPKRVIKPAITPRHSKPAPPTPAPEPVRPEPLAQTPKPTAFTEPVAAPAQPAAPPIEPAPAASKADKHAEYRDKVRAAVQAAVYYPPIAAAMHYSGRVRVEFHLQDGTPGDVRIVTSSQIGILDRAALQAVQAAHYPAPPEDLRGKDQLFQVWIALTLSPTD